MIRYSTTGSADGHCALCARAVVLLSLDPMYVIRLRILMSSIDCVDRMVRDFCGMCQCGGFACFQSVDPIGHGSQHELQWHRSYGMTGWCSSGFGIWLFRRSTGRRGSGVWSIRSLRGCHPANLIELNHIAMTTNYPEQEPRSQ